MPLAVDHGEVDANGKGSFSERRVRARTLEDNTSFELSKRHEQVAVVGTSFCRVADKATSSRDVAVASAHKVHASTPEGVLNFAHRAPPFLVASSQ